MLVVTLGRDCIENGGFVKLGQVARAIAEAKGVSNLAQAERRIFPRINAAVQLGMLNPLDPETFEPLSREDYGAGIVPFAELVAWGHATKLWNFKSEHVSPDAVPWTNAAPSLRNIAVAPASTAHAAVSPQGSDDPKAGDGKAKLARMLKNVKDFEHEPESADVAEPSKMDTATLYATRKDVKQRVEYWRSRDATTASDAEVQQRKLEPLLAELKSLEDEIEKRRSRGDYTESNPEPNEDGAQAPTATLAPPIVADIDFTVLATREQLITAFGAFTGMDGSWFRNIKDTPRLDAARKVIGQGGRSNIAEPWFCPFEVMQWLADPKRRKGRQGRKQLSKDKAWELLERHFLKVYNVYSMGDPRAAYFDHT